MVRQGECMTGGCSVFLQLSIPLTWYSFGAPVQVRIGQTGFVLVLLFPFMQVPNIGAGEQLLFALAFGLQHSTELHYVSHTF